jgi:hypothetical protein
MKPIKQYLSSALGYLGFDYGDESRGNYKKLDVLESDQPPVKVECNSLSLAHRIEYLVANRMSYAGMDLLHIKQHKEAIDKLILSLQGKLYSCLADASTVDIKLHISNELQKDFIELAGRLLAARLCKATFIKNYNLFNSELAKAYQQIISEDLDPYPLTQKLINVAVAFQNPDAFLPTVENPVRPLLVGPAGSKVKSFSSQLKECNRKILVKEEVTTFPKFYGVPEESLEVTLSYPPLQQGVGGRSNFQAISLTNSVLLELISELKQLTDVDYSVLAKGYGVGKLNEQILTLAQARYSYLLEEKLNEALTDGSPEHTPKSEETVLTLTEPTKALSYLEEQGDECAAKDQNFTAADAANMNIGILYEG